MQLKQLAPLALAGLASAQSLTEVLANQTSLSNLTSLLGQYPDLVNTLGGLSNITILAPSNDALSALLSDPATTAMISADPGLISAILTYHVINGIYRAADIPTTSAFVPTLLTNQSYTNVTGGQRVEALSSGGNVTFFSWLKAASNVTTADVSFNGGVIHIIDAVLSVPMNDSATAVAANLTALAGALATANLVSTVDGLSDVTIFAPTNDAFGAIANLLSSISTETLTTVLQYHVIQGTVGYSTGLSNTTLSTVANEDVTISLIDGSIFVNSAEVVVADYLVSNGVIHVIDNVLNPMNTTASPQPTASAQSPAFSGASSASDVPFTSGVATGGVTAPTNAATTGSSASTAGVPMQTAAMGAAALFGGAAVLANL